MTDLDRHRQDLKDHLLAHAVRTGDFVLKSGRKSNWFIDGKQTACRPEGIKLVADIILSEIERIDAIGGLTMGADPIAYGVAAIAADRGQPILPLASARKPKIMGLKAESPGLYAKATG